MADELHILTVYSAAGKPVFTTAVRTKPEAAAVAPGLIASRGASFTKVRVWEDGGRGNMVSVNRADPLDGWRELEGYAL